MQLPLARVQLPSAAVPSEKATVPVAVDGLTVAVKVTDWTGPAMSGSHYPAVTPHAEAFQAVIWHCLVTHPAVLMQANRNGFFYVLDRANGKLLSAKPFVDGVNWATGIDLKTGMPIEYDPKLDVQIYNREARALRGDGPKRACPTWHGGISHQPTAFNRFLHLDL